MRTIRYYEHGAPSVLRLEEVDEPVPGVGEVLLRSEAIGINFADVQKRQGVPMGPPARLPGSPGGDVAGTVTALGDGVTGVAVGDRVVAGLWHGAYSDVVLAEARRLIHIPAGLSAAEATTLPSQAQTAYHAVRTAGRLEAGETVLIDAAAGGVGHLAVQIAKAAGAGTVIATAGSAAKLDFARSLGADLAFDYSTDAWVEQVREATEGKGVDVILETVGNEILTQSVGLLAQFGRLVFYGAAGAQVGSSVPPIDVLSLIDSKSICGLNLYGIMFNKPDVFEAGQKDLIDMIAHKLVRPVVHAEIPLTAAASGHLLMESRAQLGRVVLVP